MKQHSIQDSTFKKHSLKSVTSICKKPGTKTLTLLMGLRQKMRQKWLQT